VQPLRPSAWLARFGATLALLSVFAAWNALRLPDYRVPAYDFYAMPHGEYFVSSGLTRRQEGSVKLGFAESYAAPPIAVYGNHIVRYFGADAFGAPERAEAFFNYGYANVSLPEQVRYLHDVEAHNHLPSQLMIVSITPPNADNGYFIIDQGNELPPDLLLDEARRSPHANAATFADAYWRTAEARLHEIFNYNTLLLGLTQNPSQQRETGPQACSERRGFRAPDWLLRLPWRVREFVGGGAVNDYCAQGDWSWTLRRDGSVNPDPQQPLVLNEDPLSDKDRGLRDGDEREIVRNLREIDAIGRRHGVKVVFLVTPVYETDRHDSVVNQVFDRALALAPDLTVIDDRSKHSDPALFVSSLHPGPAYYRLLVAELTARGLYTPTPPSGTH